jgi:hypothetical protein
MWTGAPLPDGGPVGLGLAVGGLDVGVGTGVLLAGAGVLLTALVADSDPVAVRVRAAQLASPAVRTTVSNSVSPTDLGVNRGDRGGEASRKVQPSFVLLGLYRLYPLKVGNCCRFGNRREPAVGSGCDHPRSREFHDYQRN